MFGSYGSIVGFVDLDTTKLDMGVTKAAAGLKGLEAGTAGVGSAFKALAIGGATVGAVIAGASVKMAADFDQSMRQVWSLTRESESTFKSWKEQVKEASRDLPQSATEMANALYFIKSNMPDATNAQQMKTLEIAARGAVGGLATLEDTTKALTGVTNAYRDQRPDVYMDIMAKAVERGGLKMQDFVSNQGKFVNTAANFKVPYEQVAAAFATLTRNAVPANTAAMAINQTMMAYLKPVQGAAEIAKTYGIELNANTLKTLGFGGAMMQVTNAMADDNSELAKIFPNIRALKAVLPLTGLAATDFAKDLTEVGNSAGTTNNMFEKNKGSLENIIKTVWGKFQLVMIDLGDKIIPKLEGALNAVGRVLDGHNAAFNKFGAVIKGVAAPVFALTDALLKFWPVLLMVGGGIAAIKFSGLLSAISTASTSMPLLNNVIANMKLGFTSSAASVGGFATSLGTIGLMAAPAALAVALLVKHWKDGDAAGQAAQDTIIGFNKANADTGLKLQPMVDKYLALRTAVRDMNAAGQDSTATTAEMVEAGKALAAASSDTVAAIDAQGNAIIKSDTQLKQLIQDLLEFSGISISGKGESGQLQGLEQSQKNLQKTSADMAQQLNYVRVNLEALGIPSSQAAMVVRRLEGDMKGGMTAAQAFITQIKEAPGAMDNWTNTLSGLGLPGNKQNMEDLESALSQLDAMFKQSGMTLDDVKKKISETDIAMAQLRQQMMTDASQGGFTLGAGAITAEMVTNLKSSSPVLRATGHEMIANVAAGMLQARGLIGADAAGLAQHMSDLLVTGAAWDGTGGAIGKEVYDAIKAQLGGTIITAPTVQPQVDSSNVDKGKQDSVLGWLVPTLVPTVDSGNVDKSKGNAGTGWPIPGITPSVDMSNVDNAKASLANPWSAVVNLFVQTQVNPTFDHPRDAGKYIAEQLTQGAAGAKLTMGGAGILTGLMGQLKEFEAAWRTLSQTAIVGWSRDVDNAKFGEIEQAITNLAPDGKALDAWRLMRKEYDQSKAALDVYSAALDASTQKQEAMSHQQELLQRQLQGYQKRLQEVQSGTNAWRDATGKLHLSLQTLSQIKITGQTAREDLSFNQQQQLNKLELERLQIQQRLQAGKGTSADYQRLFEINKAKQALDLQKQIDDLATSTKYEPQEKAIKDMLDPLHGVEKSQAQIVADIKAGLAEQAKYNKLVAANQAAQDKLTVAMNVQKDKARLMRLEYDAMQKSMQTLETILSGMMSNFQKQFQDMKAAAEAAARAAEAANKGGGGAPPQYAYGGRVDQTGVIYAHEGEEVLTPREATLWRQMKSTGASTTTTTDNSRAMQIFNFDKLVLPGVTDGQGLMDELRKLKTRQALP
jgi:TP901 family phage tail tape measure protein